MSYEFPVEAGHIMMFARAVGDPNPVYSDATYAASTEAGGIVAPPTFVQAASQFDPDYPYRPRIGEPWYGSTEEPSGVPAEQRPVGVGLHAEQHFQYHRSVRAGDVLTVRTRAGKRWTKQSPRNGQLEFSETITEYRDASGAVVVTARMVKVVAAAPIVAGP
ncbi:MAG TPA: MaoC family dehydratase N-terminal domain-containing protein [Pseudonocardia sp.]|jgi:acyl dehydratase